MEAPTAVLAHGKGCHSRDKGVRSEEKKRWRREAIQDIRLASIASIASLRQSDPIIAIDAGRNRLETQQTQNAQADLSNSLLFVRGSIVLAHAGGAASDREAEHLQTKKLELHQ